MGNTLKYLLIAAFLSTLLFAYSSPCHAEDYASDVQAIIGATIWDDDDLTFQTSSTEEPSANAELDLSTMPTLGAAWWGTFRGERVQTGLEAGFLVSWMSDKSRVSGGGTGSAILQVETSLVLLDFFTGLHIESQLSPRTRLYAAAGPLLMFGWATDEQDEYDGVLGRRRNTEETENDVGFGLYGRAGVEISLDKDDWIGLGVRALDSELDFSDTIGKVELNGVQISLTYTKEL